MSSQPTSGPSGRNRAMLLAALRAAGESTRADLAASTGLSVATISRAANALIAAGLIVQESEAGPGRGRPLGRLRIDKHAACVLAVDVADRHTTLAFVDLDGTVMSFDRLDTPPTDPRERLQHTLEAIAAHCDSDAPTRGPIAVGVAVPGPVRADGSIPLAPALQWQDVPLRQLLEGRLNVPVAVGNDANLIAVAESRFGDYRDVASLFALAVFEGVGSGVVEGGTLVEGSRGFAGQFGRMFVSFDSQERLLDEFGDLESQLGSAGLARRAADAGVQLPSDREIFEALFAQIQDDSPAGALGRKVLDEFAVALANVCALLDPEAIVLAGRFAPLTDVVAPELERRLRGRVLHIPRLVPTSTGVDAALLGAAGIALDAFGPLEQLLHD